jgi:O-antigen ligase
MVKQGVVKKAGKGFSEVKWIFTFAVLITLFINPKLTDPFNAPKMYLLILSSVVVFSFLIFQKKITPIAKSEKTINSFLYLFLTIFAIQVLFTDLKYAAIFGDNLRQIGFLTYLGFVIFMLATIKFFEYEARTIFYNSIIILSAFYVVYGIVQYSGNDPFNWVNQYNPIIGTLGNPNYTAALMAVLATLCFSIFFDQELKSAKRILFAAVSILLAIVVYLTDASQGLLSMAAGVGLFVTVKLFKFKPMLGLASLIVLITGATVALAGILQSGPLERFLYKPSVSLRGYYWHSGLEMLQKNWLTGVGIERFGAHFRQNVDPEFPIKFGYELMTTNAHNVPIQLFATGGIFLGLAYLVILSLVLLYAVIGIYKLSGNRLNLLVGMFAAWVAYQLQSLVSIDNIGLTIWGWVLGGGIIGLVTSSIYVENTSLRGDSIRIVRKKLGSNLQPLVTGVILIFSLVLVLRLTQSESVMFKNKAQFNQVSTQGQDTLYAGLTLVINDPLAQPFYKIDAADMFFRMGDSQAAIVSAEKVVKQDPINPTYLGVLATMYEAASRFNEAINQRLTLSKYDPNNAKNYLQLIKLYKQVGDITKATQILNKIVSLTPSSEVADLARRELQ